MRVVILGKGKVSRGKLSKDEKKEKDKYEESLVDEEVFIFLLLLIIRIYIKLYNWKLVREVV